MSEMKFSKLKMAFGMLLLKLEKTFISFPSYKMNYLDSMGKTWRKRRG